MKILFSLLFFLCPLALAEPKVTDQDYAELKKLSAEILKKYPPDQYYFIGAGRSPDPLITLMELTQPGCCSVIPYSNKVTALRGLELRVMNGHLRWIRNPYHPEEHKAAFAWLDHYFPKPEVLKGRKVVTLDYTSLGLGAAHFSALLETYNRERKLKLEHTAVGLNAGGANQTIRKIFRHIGIPIELIPLSKYPGLHSRLENSEFKDLSRSPELTDELVLAGPPVLPSPGHENLVRQLRGHLDRDADLCRHVNQAS